MTDDLKLWEEDGKRFGWVMPKAARWKRLPVIRRFRAVFHSIRLERHNRFWAVQGCLISGYDEWVLFGIAMGKERGND
jgi:hypothetical protein